MLDIGKYFQVFLVVMLCTFIYRLKHIYSKVAIGITIPSPIH